MNVIINSPADGGFLKQVKELSQANLSRCSHCLGCGGGCPVSQDMDYMPNVILRMIQFGQKERVLKSSTIWMCVGCNTCSNVCPNAVDMAAVMDALRQIAILEKIDIAEPGILSFHKSVINSIYRYGRAHKLDIMMRYKFYERDLFTDSFVGMKMLLKRKLELFPSKIKDQKRFKALFDAGSL